MLIQTLPDFRHEADARTRGFFFVAGVDEVGRGPLAGPVTAAAVILHEARVPDGLNDSKKLTAAKRRELYLRLLDVADVSVAHASVQEIDEINILRASHVAMVRAIQGLRQVCDYALIDGNMICRGMPCQAIALVKGDALSLSIAAASIVAKVVRDDIMAALADQHPGYGWERNAGYPTKQHQDALLNLGVTPHHRRSFKPIHNILNQVELAIP